MASSIIKFIWSSGSTYHNLMDEAQTHSKMMKVKPPVTSGSDNSAMGDAENSEVSNHPSPSQCSRSNLMKSPFQVDSSSDGDDMNEDTAPCKKMKLAYTWNKKKPCKSNYRIILKTILFGIFH